MSLKRAIVNDGQGATALDLQAIADTVAGADDRVFESLLTLDPNTKKIVPLQPESTTVNPALLVIPSPSVNGEVRVLPAVYIAGPGTGFAVAMSLRQTFSVDTGLIGANSSGSPRIDAIYASIQRGVTVTGQRKIKSSATGDKTTQTVNLADEVELAIVVLPNVSSGSPFAGMPSDTADAFYFPLAVLAIPNGYTSGSAIPQSQIAQNWTGGGIPRTRIQRYTPASLFVDGITQSPATPIRLDRWGVGIKLFAVVKQTTTGDVILDRNFNWTRRMIKGDIMRVSRMGSAPYYPGPELATIAGNDAVPGTFLPGFTGTNNGTATGCTLSQAAGFNAGAAGTQVIALHTDSSNRLVINFNTLPFDTTNGDNWLVTIEATDQFAF